MRPVVSYSSLRKGKLKNPRNGLDRLHLTDVGEIVWNEFGSVKLNSRLRRADPPFPWEMAFFQGGVEVANLTGHFIGPSTYRSIFQMRFLEGSSGEELTRRSVGTLDRELLASKYWTNETWSRFIKMAGMSKKEILEINENTEIYLD